MDHRFETELWNDRGSIPASYYLFSIGTYLHAAWAWIFYIESIGRVDAIPNPWMRVHDRTKIVKSMRNDAPEGEGWNERTEPFCRVVARLPLSRILFARPTDFSRAKRGMKRMETLRKMSIDSSGSNRVVSRLLFNFTARPFIACLPSLRFFFEREGAATTVRLAINSKNSKFTDRNHLRSLLWKKFEFRVKTLSFTNIREKYILPHSRILKINLEIVPVSLVSSIPRYPSFLSSPSLSLSPL